MANSCVARLHQRSAWVSSMGETWMKTEVMCGYEWKTSDCVNVSTAHASGPLDTRKTIWKSAGDDGKAKR